MTDPLTYLTAALDAAQRDAEDAEREAPSPWDPGTEYGGAHVEARNGSAAVVGSYDYLDWSVRRHVARHDPASTLRRIAADRKMLAEHAPGDNESGVCDSECRTCWGPDSVRGECVKAKPYPCTTVRLLAEGWGWTEEEQQ